MVAKKKLITPTFEITYWDVSTLEEKATVKVRPVPFSKLDDLIKLQEQILDYYVAQQGCIANLLRDKSVKATLKKIASLLPVVGEEKPGFDLDNLFEASDMIQIAQIFFTEAFDENVHSEGIVVDEVTKRQIYMHPKHRYSPTPSKIARIHDLDFFELYQTKRDKFLIQLREEQEQRIKKELSDLDQAQELEKTLEEKTLKVQEMPALT